MIRLARIGKKKQPHYRLVVSEKTRDMYGRALEIVGHYNPRSKAAELKRDRISHWLGNGAQSSATVHNLLVTQGLIEEKKVSVSTINNKKRAKMTAKERAAVEAKAAAEEAAKAKAAEAEAAAAAPAEEPAATEAPAAEETPAVEETKE